MNVTRNGTQFLVDMDGSIGETTPLFTLKLDGCLQLVLNMNGVKSINSIGVKHWILWTLRIPKTCKIQIVNCPYVITSQASIVLGFISPNMKIESFRAPFICAACEAEEVHLLTRGKDFEYGVPPLKSKIMLPLNLTCAKCNKGVLEPDFIVEKAFKFLG
jgi:hypothetical protein